MYIFTTGGATPPHWLVSVKYSLKVYSVRTKLKDVIVGLNFIIYNREFY